VQRRQLFKFALPSTLFGTWERGAYVHCSNRRRLYNSGDLMHIVPVDINAIVESDLRWLAKLDKLGFDKRSAKEYLVEIGTGRMTLWRVGDSGIVITTLVGDSLWIEGLAGEFDLKATLKVRDWLRRLMVRADKYYLRLAVNNIRLERIYKRLGFKPVATIMEASQ
jgi:hypothetical protein